MSDEQKRNETPEEKAPKCPFCGEFHDHGAEDGEHHEEEIGFSMQVKIGMVPEGAAHQFLTELTTLLNEKKPNNNVIFSVFSQFAGLAAARSGMELVEAIQIMVFGFTEAYKSEKEDEAREPRAMDGGAGKASSKGTQARRPLTSLLKDHR